MKIRTGFVSNSSSSSFCILYNKATIKDVNDDNFAILTECWEGPIYFKLNEDMKKYLIKHAEEDIQPEYQFIKLLYDFPEGNRLFHKDELIKKLSNTDETIYCFHAEGSINSPYDLNSFIDWLNGN